MFISRSVCETVGLLCNREHRSPCLHAPICCAQFNITQCIIARVSDERKHSKERERKRRRSKKEESPRAARQRARRRRHFERERERERERAEKNNARRDTNREERAERREKRERSKFFSFPNRRRALCLLYRRTPAHLEVKRTVHAILLRPEDGRQVFRHPARLSFLFFSCDSGPTRLSSSSSSSSSLCAF
jgi:hypothetical protein